MVDLFHLDPHTKQHPRVPAVVGAIAKPTVIKYEQFHADRLRGARDLEQTVLCKPETGSLPVVE